MNHLIWRKSSYSMNQGGECVEIARLPHAVGIRDSKNPNHGHLTITPNAHAVGIRDSKNPNHGHLTITPNAFRTLTHHIKQEQLTR